MNTFRLIVLAFLLLLPLKADDLVLSMKERAETINELLAERVDLLLPELMRRSNIDMWLIIGREYNEDPVLKTMLPATWLSARRRTILVFYDRGEELGVEALAIARYNVGSVFQKAWDKEQQPDQWQRLVEIIQERDPQQIGVNRSQHFALADGITATGYHELMDAMPNNIDERIVSAEKLCLGWLETRTESELKLYRKIVGIAHEIIAGAFSNAVITPGKTTTEDVVWWFREEVRERKLTAWFHPTVMIQRSAHSPHGSTDTFPPTASSMTIQPGDLLHCDFGITYLRLNTDTQQHAYVLTENETEAPSFLVNALKTGNRLQDILTANFEVGRTGNDVLKASREQAIAEGIRPSIYTHPIGFHGHGAGTTLGMWDSQGGVPVRGDYPLHANTAYAIELNAQVHIEEWGRDIRIMLEEDAVFDGKTVDYLDGRQTELLLISSN